MSAIAQHTERIRLGSAVSVLPVRNPIQVAEDYALVDILSGGRLNMGVGTGSQPTEFAGLGADFEGRRAAFAENLQVLKRRWAAASSGERGVHSLNVAPLQAPTPPVYVTSNREEGAREIGLQGHSLLTLVSPALEDLSDVQARAFELTAAGWMKEVIPRPAPRRWSWSSPTSPSPSRRHEASPALPLDDFSKPSATPLRRTLQPFSTR